MKLAIPAYLTDYNSIQNPILTAFASRIMVKPDENQVPPAVDSVGLNAQSNSKMIDPVVLGRYGAREVRLKKDDIVFQETEEALNYFQVLQGSIKMITITPEGREFIQGIFKTNDSFGEPPLFCSSPYPSTAVALEKTIIIKLPKARFFLLLQENFEIHLHLDKVLCDRLKYKSMVLSEISSYDPEHRITSLLKYLKNKSHQQEILNDNFIVPFTRQQIADMSGLRVETVIRTVKKMEEEGKLKVVSRKIVL